MTAINVKTIVLFNVKKIALALHATNNQSPQIWSLTLNEYNLMKMYLLWILSQDSWVNFPEFFKF